MARPFDPYHKWLGIPPEEQPPDHYRLLGVRLFEDDPDVIDYAADGRMALVRNFQAGAHARLSEQLLNELAAARITLLTPAKRAAYDEQLRSSQPKAATAPTVKGDREPIPIELTLPQARAATPSQASRTAWPLPAILCSAVVLVIGIGVLVLALNRDAGEPTVPVAAKPATNRPATPEPAPPQPAPSKPDDPVSPAPVERNGSADVEQITLPADKRVLLIFGFDNELQVAKAACEKYGLRYDIAKTFDKDRSDYSAWHTVMCGSNDMDYWQSKEAAKSEAFNGLGQFVTGGGHLVLLGSYNARGTKHLQRFGIETGFLHNENFLPVGRATELLVQGNEDLVPEHGRMRSFGNFKVKAPHVVLLKNGEGRYGAGEPKLTTLMHDQGRVTYTLVEPNQTKGMWLITVLLSWVSRGSPIPAQN